MQPITSATLRRIIAAERQYLYDGLTGLGLRVIPGRANFLLFYTGESDLCHRLYENGILIRDCSDFVGLKKGWYRIAVRTHEDNMAFLSAYTGSMISDMASGSSVASQFGTADKHVKKNYLDVDDTSGPAFN